MDMAMLFNGEDCGKFQNFELENLVSRQSAFLLTLLLGKPGLKTFKRKWRLFSGPFESELAVVNKRLQSLRWNLSNIFLRVSIRETRVYNKPTERTRQIKSSTWNWFWRHEEVTECSRGLALCGRVGIPVETPWVSLVKWSISKESPVYWRC